MGQKKLLICGATGFIGRNLLNYFLEKKTYEICAQYHTKPIPNELSGRSDIHWIQADLTNSKEVHAAVQGKDLVIQAAATTSGAKDIVSKPYLHVTDNAVMNAYLFRACHEHQVKRVVFLSCTVMYSSGIAPVKEEDFTGDINDKYFGAGWTKVYNEKMCEFYSKLGNTQYTVLRHSNVYGPHDKFDLEKSHVFGATVTKVLTAQGEKIVVWGDGSDERDFLYARDLTDFISLILEKQTKPFELLNVGTGEAYSVSQLVQKIIDHSGKNLKIEYDRTKPNIGFKLALNIDRAKSYGWAPKVLLDSGIKKTLEWYQKNLVASGA
jgi:GDP-L-fucose synthase